MHFVWPQLYILRRRVEHKAVSRWREKPDNDFKGKNTALWKWPSVVFLSLTIKDMVYLILSHYAHFHAHHFILQHCIPPLSERCVLWVSFKAYMCKLWKGATCRVQTNLLLVSVKMKKYMEYTVLVSFYSFLHARWSQTVMVKQSSVLTSTVRGWTWTAPVNTRDLDCREALRRCLLIFLLTHFLFCFSPTLLWTLIWQTVNGLYLYSTFLVLATTQGTLHHAVCSNTAWRRKNTRQPRSTEELGKV